MRTQNKRQLMNYLICLVLIFSLSVLSQAAVKKKTTKSSSSRRVVVHVSPKVKEVKSWTGPENTQIAFYLQGNVDYDINAIPGAMGFVLQANNATSSDGDQVIPVNDGTVESITINNTGNSCRVTIRFVEPTSYKVSGEHPDRNFPLIEVTRPVAKRPVYPSAQQIAAYRKSNNIIVIDPGHGGWHSGAGGNGLQEKNVTMEIALKLKDKLDQVPGIKCFLTRDTAFNNGDYYVSLNRRRVMASELGADLFLSIHLNAPGSARSTDVRGTEIYYMEYGEASDAEAERLADLENAADLEYSSTGQNNDPVSEVLQDQRLVALRNQSAVFASLVMNNLMQVGSLSNRGIKHARFAVLKCTMPSVLLEVGFVTNPYESGLLGSRDFQEQAAGKMTSAVNQYLAINHGRPTTKNTESQPLPTDLPFSVLNLQPTTQ